jgi:hypothetical protein
MSNTFLRSDARFASPSPGDAGINAPTYQSFLSGSGTYTPTGGTVRIKVRMCGGGGGAGGTAGGNGAAGIILIEEFSY